ncbi:hypothetical protein [Marinilactibacillus sp. 15R]|uniref:hypothetical protein n=1 Tax=Marinilactibacillus sp. 15R TaxID=1911586 RepID=UPI000AC1A32A|nr:hypothetical protein [Marinilactibacillus sp. 15R]
MKVEYAVYKKEDLLCIGTIEECAKQLGVKAKTIFFYGTPTYQNRVKNGRVLVKLEG